ncbi:MAG: DUF1027 domain-containing protein [Bacilli bacterium]|nr:DUF1027 domain-containing protein [Bacilli bacterium]MDD4733474.1 DUF1027 domain-containing protein [Bacilli bacterium]
MKKVLINGKEYELIKEYKEGFDLSEVTDKLTDYFDEYDYVFGDWSYGKLRLKGFCDKKNKRFNQTNNIEKIDDYIKKYCSYECKYFLLKK